jgi:hypothetical protein
MVTVRARWFRLRNRQADQSDVDSTSVRSVFAQQMTHSPLSRSRQSCHPSQPPGENGATSPCFCLGTRRRISSSLPTSPGLRGPDYLERLTLVDRFVSASGLSLIQLGLFRASAHRAANADRCQMSHHPHQPALLRGGKSGQVATINECLNGCLRDRLTLRPHVQLLRPAIGHRPAL